VRLCISFSLQHRLCLNSRITDGYCTTLQELVTIKLIYSVYLHFKKKFRKIAHSKIILPIKVKIITLEQSTIRVGGKKTD
jgi:hypothetical protein